MHVIEVCLGEAILRYKGIAASGQTPIERGESDKRIKSSTRSSSSNRTVPSPQGASRQRDGMGCQHARWVGLHHGVEYWRVRGTNPCETSGLLQNAEAAETMETSDEKKRTRGKLAIICFLVIHRCREAVTDLAILPAGSPAANPGSDVINNLAPNSPSSMS